MALPITEEPKCTKRHEHKARKSRSKWERFKRGVIKTMKIVLRTVLLNPSTWRIMMVHVPNLFELLERIVTKAISFFTDLF